MMKGEARYRAIGEIARGGWGMVLEAEDLVRRRVVAMKVLLPMLRGDAIAIARLVLEGRVMQRLAHPNICTVLDEGTLEDGRPFLVMERLVGETLRSRIKRSLLRKIDVETMIEISVQLLSALDAVHSGEIIHRDVKPENIFLVHDAWGRTSVKLLDFGVCCPTVRDESSLTGSWCVIGTPAYMAPEVALGDRGFDERADLYCVGLILHEALSGQRFLSRDSELVHVATRPRLPLLRTLDPDLPYVLERVVARALERDPRARYQSAQELLHDLLEARTAFRRRPTTRRSRAVERLAPLVRNHAEDAPTRVLGLGAELA